MHLNEFELINYKSQEISIWLRMNVLLHLSVQQLFVPYEVRARDLLPDLVPEMYSYHSLPSGRKRPFKKVLAQHYWLYDVQLDPRECAQLCHQLVVDAFGSWLLIFLGALAFALVPILHFI